MTTLLLLLAVIALLAAGAAVVRAVRSDGYGRRRPPASHVADVWEPSDRWTPRLG